MTLALVGELDMAETPALTAELDRIEAERPELVLVDLSALDFVDSHGLEVLVGATRRAEAAGRRLLFVPPPEPVRQILRVTLLDRRFAWVPQGESLDDALADALRTRRAAAPEPSI